MTLSRVFSYLYFAGMSIVPKAAQKTAVLSVAKIDFQLVSVS